MKNSNNNVMWIQGAAATGKTRMANFLESTKGFCFIYELETNGETCRMINIAAKRAMKNIPLEVLPIGLSDLVAVYPNHKIIIFSQDPPPPFLSNAPFNPLLITLK